MKPWEMMRRFGASNGSSGSNPYWSHTVLQLHFEGASVIDTGPLGIDVYVNSPAALSSAQPRFGSGCLYVPGAGYIYNPTGNAALAAGMGDIFISISVYMASSAGQQIFFDSRNSSSGGGGFAIYTIGGVLQYYNGAVHDTGVSVPVGEDKWIDFSRVSGISYLFVDGALAGTFADASDYTSGQFFIGAAAYTPVGAAAMSGYLDEFRCVIGMPGPTSAFTPPTSAFLDGP